MSGLHGLLSRRQLVGRLALGGAAGWLGLGDVERAGAEPPPETGRIRLVRTAGTCLAPQHMAEELLRSEGFSDIGYVTATAIARIYDAINSGEADLTQSFVAPFLLDIDAGKPVVLLAGIHPGCHELFGSDRVRTIRDLKGRTVAVPAELGPHHLFVASMAAYVGLDPTRDIRWAIHPPAEAMRLLGEDKVDAYLAFPPQAQELRARKIGRVVASLTHDRPWSQYFCCMLGANREFVRRYPVATKRAIRAILKAASVCAAEPERVARSLVDRGLAASYEYTLQRRG